MTPLLLTWKERNQECGPGSLLGIRRGVVMFTIHWNALTRGPEGKDYHMYTRLPGYKDNARWGAQTEDELKEMAEEIFAGFIKRMGLAAVEP